jgi:hypothetical protein
MIERGRIESALRDLASAQHGLTLRDPEINLDCVCKVLDEWRKPDSRVRRALETELPQASGFDAAMVHDGLNLALANWSGDALRALVAAEFPRGEGGGSSGGLAASGFPVTSVLLAGSIPMPSLLASVLPLVLGSAVAVKPASRDLVTPRLVAESLAEIDPLLGRCIAVLPFSSDDEEAARAFFSSDCVVATGSDETLAQVSRFISAQQR